MSTTKNINIDESFRLLGQVIRGSKKPEDFRKSFTDNGRNIVENDWIDRILKSKEFLESLSNDRIILSIRVVTVGDLTGKEVSNLDEVYRRVKSKGFYTLRQEDIFLFISQFGFNNQWLYFLTGNAYFNCELFGIYDVDCSDVNSKIPRQVFSGFKIDKNRKLYFDQKIVCCSFDRNNKSTM